MSQRSWNRGLDAAVNGEPASFGEDYDYYAGFAYGQPEPERPEPTIQELCGGGGHPPYPNSENDRCYCGEWVRPKVTP